MHLVWITLICKKGCLVIYIRDAIGDLQLAALMWVKQEPIVSEYGNDEVLVTDLGTLRHFLIFMSHSVLSWPCTRVHFVSG